MCWSSLGHSSLNRVSFSGSEGLCGSIPCCRLNRNLVRFVFTSPQPMGLGTTGLFTGQRLFFHLTEKLLPENMACPFLRTKLCQGYSHCHFPLLSWQGGVEKEGEKRRRKRRLGERRRSTALGALSWEGQPQDR